MKRFLVQIADKKFIWIGTLFIGVFVALIIAIASQMTLVKTLGNIAIFIP